MEPAADDQNKVPYRYPHFRRAILFEDLSFHGGPSPGQPMPDFDVPNLAGSRTRKGDFVGRQPLFLTPRRPPAQ
jgi:hypothetical protein